MDKISKVGLYSHISSRHQVHKHIPCIITLSKVPPSYVVIVSSKACPPFRLQIVISSIAPAPSKEAYLSRANSCHGKIPPKLNYASARGVNTRAGLKCPLNGKCIYFRDYVRGKKKEKLNNVPIYSSTRKISINYN